ncbi:hypothetical protein DPX39_110147700 [Trypanosoma brucei equiperdum]|uniref:Endonuclease-reverse transcriptase n=1 Tax=Trypanosoma brucei equiperdum TaxID=630700 RepID=A0A3L6KXY6_9TRYP|nr:hypothetical protein DPX39_110147700 [Trypanosoma brucei equiperdum]
MLVRDSVRVIQGSKKEGLPERVSVTLMFTADLMLTIKSVYFQQKEDFTTSTLESLENVENSTRPLVTESETKADHDLRNPLCPNDTAGECIVEWCLQNDIKIANDGTPTRRMTHTETISSLDVTIYRDCEVTRCEASLSPDSDHYWITCEVFIGIGVGMIAITKPRRPLYT